MQGTARVRQALNQLDSFDTTTLKQLEAFMLKSCRKLEELKKESARASWNPIFNTAVEFFDKADQDDGVAWYMSTNRRIKAVHGEG